MNLFHIFLIHFQLIKIVKPKQIINNNQVFRLLRMIKVLKILSFPPTQIFYILRLRSRHSNSHPSFPIPHFLPSTSTLSLKPTISVSSTYHITLAFSKLNENYKINHLSSWLTSSPLGTGSSN